MNEHMKNASNRKQRVNDGFRLDFMKGQILRDVTLITDISKDLSAPVVIVKHLKRSFYVSNYLPVYRA